MKTNKIAALLVSQLFERKIIDESAETCEEIALAHPGKNIWKIRQEIRNMVASGKVEQVLKRGAKCLIPAYRIKQNENTR